MLEKLSALMPQLLVLLGTLFFLAGAVLSLVRAWRALP